MRARARSSAGQASAEYVAVLAVVAAVLTSALAVVAVPALAPAVSSTVRHGICIVAGGICTPREARAAGMEPCLVHSRGDSEQLAATVISLRVGRNDELLLERRSDGTASVSFIDGRRAGVEAGIGLKLGWGEALTGGAGLQFTGGRTWEFPSAAAAGRFVHRWAREETITGELRSLPRRLCLFCHGRPKPPPPQTTYREAGAYGEFSNDIGLPLVYARQSPVVRAEGSLGAVVGRRVRGRLRTWYLRVGGVVAGRLGALMGAVEATRGGDAALEVTFDGDRPVLLRVRVAAALHHELDLLGATTPLRELAGKVRRATDAGEGVHASGLGVEAQVSLDLTDERNRRAALDFAGMLRPGVSPAGWGDRTRALAGRLDADGSVDVGVFRSGPSSVQDHDVGAAFSLKLGGAYRREVQSRNLVRAWSLRHGGALGEREDCLSA